MHKTYTSAVIQAKGYNTLREHVINVLQKYQLSSTEWSALGHIYNLPDVRLIDLSRLLQIDAPHITALIDQLETMNWVGRRSDPNDRRVKKIVLTKHAKAVIPNIESELSDEMAKLLEGTTPQELETYFKILETIINNSKKLKGGEK